MSDDDQFEPWAPAYENGTVCVVLEDMDDILMPGSIVKILSADTGADEFGPDGIYNVGELFARPGRNYCTEAPAYRRFFESELQPVKDAFCDSVTKEGEDAPT